MQLRLAADMPRYCAVKACRNRGGCAPRRGSERISFYPFPLQDKPRLQKWVENVGRERWTPSRHQCLCSEHFTEDCFDVRWGIRYLKSTAVPTVFPSTENDGEKTVTTIKRSPKPKPRTLDTGIEPTGFDCPVSKRSLILNRTCKKFQSSKTNNTAAEDREMILELPLLSDTGHSCHANPSEKKTAAFEVPGDSGMQTASCLALPACDEPHSEKHADSPVAVLCCDLLGPFSDGEAKMGAPALGQAFRYVAVETNKDEATGSLLEERGPSEGEHISVYEHSYCRPDTDKDQLWSKILSLNTKILELDRREESTVAKIHALETEIALLRRDGAVFKAKQKVLEDYISSTLL